MVFFVCVWVKLLLKNLFKYTFLNEYGFLDHMWISAKCGCEKKATKLPNEITKSWCLVSDNNK